MIWLFSNCPRKDSVAIVTKDFMCNGENKHEVLEGKARDAIPNHHGYMCSNG